MVMCLLDLLFKVATLVIAGANVYYVCHFHKINNQKDENREERERKLNLLKSLVLDYNLKYLYDFFDKCDSKCKELKIKDIDCQEKTEINATLIKYERDLENNFVNLLMAVDENLYESVKNTIDEMIDRFSKSIFDEGVNLYVEDKYNDLIHNPIVSAKRGVIEALFNYKGE